MTDTNYDRLGPETTRLVANTPLCTQLTGMSDKKWHRINEIRKNQHISLAHCARRLGLTTQEARLQEEPTNDLTLSQLMAWQELLEVPVSELIIQEDEIPDPIRNRALLLKVMKTAKQILKTAQEPRIKNMATTLVDQLIELMPELENVSPWPDIGQSHENRDYGQAAYRRFDADVVRKFDSHF